MHALDSYGVPFMSIQPAISTPRTIRVYNSLSRTTAPLEPVHPGHTGMYVCGVTVYDHAHIGHAMYAVIFDMIRRYLMHAGYEVRFVQNFTDIDDKIIDRANRDHIDYDELTESLIAEWNAEILALNVLPPTVAPRATAEIPNIITMIEGLISAGFAYPSDGDVFFKVRAFPEYGKLSNRKVDQLLVGTRLDVNERKSDPLDFALWKSARSGEPAWPSPWGLGRPGWHIECSAMCSHHLDDAVDIHGGGRDLIFPHHENEIAQSEAFSGQQPFARIWMHNGMMQLNGEKMSKSRGNVIRIRDILDADRSAAFRLLVLQTHYRSPINFTNDNLEAAETGLSRLRSALRPADDGDVESGPQAPGLELDRMSRDADHRFHQAMDNDFDTPGAIAAIFDLGRAINREKSLRGESSAIRNARQTLGSLASVLGLDLTAPESVPATAHTVPLVELLIAVRNRLRKDRQFEIADMIREGLLEQGITLEDAANDSHWVASKTRPTNDA